MTIPNNVILLIHNGLQYPTAKMRKKMRQEIIAGKVIPSSEDSEMALQIRKLRGIPHPEFC